MVEVAEFPDFAEDDEEEVDDDDEDTDEASEFR